MKPATCACLVFLLIAFFACANADTWACESEGSTGTTGGGNTTCEEQWGCQGTTTLLVLRCQSTTTSNKFSCDCIENGQKISGFDYDASLCELDGTAVTAANE